MVETIGYQLVSPLVRACPVNANTSAFTAKTAGTTTRPAGNLVFDLAPILGAGGGFRARCRLFPIGVGSNDDAFSLRVWGWSRFDFGASGSAAPVWVPAELLEVSCTLGSFAGVAGGLVAATELFADTITMVKEPTLAADVTPAGTTEIMSPANDTPAWVEFRLRGVELLEFDFDQTTNTPTMNALLQFLGGEK